MRSNLSEDFMTNLSLHLTPRFLAISAHGRPAIRALVALAMTAMLILPLILAG